MIPAHRPTTALLNLAFASLTACSDRTPSGPDAVDLHFAKVDAGKPVTLTGPVWGGLMSAQRDIEAYMLEEGRWLMTEIAGENHEFGLYMLDGFTAAEVRVRETRVVAGDLHIPYRVEGDGILNFYCPFANGEEDPWDFMVWYGPMPLVATGRIFVGNMDEQNFRSAVEFRAWLQREFERNPPSFFPPDTDFISITYDENCVPTQTFP